MNSISHDSKNGNCDEDKTPNDEKCDIINSNDEKTYGYQNINYGDMPLFRINKKKFTNVLSLIDTLNIQVALKYLNIDKKLIEMFLKKNGLNKRILEHIKKYVDNELMNADPVSNSNHKIIKRKYCQALSFSHKLLPEDNLNEKIAIFSGHYLLAKGNIREKFPQKEYEDISFLWMFGKPSKSRFVITQLKKDAKHPKAISEIRNGLIKSPFFMTPVLAQLYLLNIKRTLHHALLIDVVSDNSMREDHLRMSLNFYDKVVTNPYRYKLTSYKSCEYITKLTNIKIDQEERRIKKLQDFLSKNL